VVEEARSKASILSILPSRYPLSNFVRFRLAGFEDEFVLGKGCSRGRQRRLERVQGWEGERSCAERDDWERQLGIKILEVTFSG
jgi:hypothetical protein